MGGRLVGATSTISSSNDEEADRQTRRMTMDRILQPTISGTVREMEVPDTLDLADLAALALNGLGGDNYESLMTMYGQINLERF